MQAASRPALVYQDERLRHQATGSDFTSARQQRLLKGDVEMNHRDILEAADQPVLFSPAEFFAREVEPKLRTVPGSSLGQAYIRSVRLEFLDCSSEVLSDFIDMVAAKIDPDNAPFEKFELSQPERAFAQLSPTAVQAFADKVLPSIQELNLTGLRHSSPQVIATLTSLLVQVASGPQLARLTVSDFCESAEVGNQILQGLGSSAGLVQRLRVLDLSCNSSWWASEELAGEGTCVANNVDLLCQLLLQLQALTHLSLRGSSFESA